MGRAVGLLTVIIVGIAGGYSGYDMWTSAPNEIRLDTILSAPAVAVNEAFTLEIEIENVDVSLEVQINAVGLERSLLNGLTVDSVIVINGGQEIAQSPGNWADYKLDQSLAGGSKMRIRYTLHATQPGTYEGEVNVWVDSEMIAGVTRSKARSESVQIRVQ